MIQKISSIVTGTRIYMTPFFSGILNAHYAFTTMYIISINRTPVAGAIKRDDNYFMFKMLSVGSKCCLKTSRVKMMSLMELSARDKKKLR